MGRLRILIPIEHGNPTTDAILRPVPASRATYFISFLAIPEAMEGTRLVDMAMAIAVGTLIMVITIPL